MRILIRHLMPDGLVKESNVEADRLSIGRGTNQSLPLSGAIVALEHAEIHPVAQDVFRLASKSSVGVELNGQSGVKESVLKVGDVITVGGHRIVVIPRVERYDLVLEVQLAAPELALSRASSKLDLEMGGLSQRKLALGIVATLLLVGLLIPLLMIAAGRPALLMRVLPADGIWAPGPVASGHAHFGSQCDTCHAAPFSAIKDSSCVQCHESMKHHSDQTAIHAVSGFADRGCVDCHQEHRGQGALISQHPKLCVDCHGEPEEFSDFPAMSKVVDFKRTHPEFRYTVSTLDVKNQKLVTSRIQREEGVPLRDISGSLFPHDSHLAENGIKGPNGTEKLICGSCHAPDTARAGFRNLDFEKHCQRCHELKLETPDRTIELPHGQNDATRFLVETFYLPFAKQQSVSITAEQADLTARRRIGVLDEIPKVELTDRELVTEVFEFQVCGKCHLIDVSGEQPRVIPPVLRHTWMPAAKFAHTKHDAVPCRDCHSVATSKTGADLNLPSIQSCRSCHTDPHESDGVPSTCVSCHALHRAEHQKMGAAVEQLPAQSPTDKSTP